MVLCEVLRTSAWALRSQLRRVESACLCVEGSESIQHTLFLLCFVYVDILRLELIVVASIPNLQDSVDVVLDYNPLLVTFELNLKGLSARRLFVRAPDLGVGGILVYAGLTNWSEKLAVLLQCKLPPLAVKSRLQTRVGMTAVCQTCSPPQCPAS